MCLPAHGPEPGTDVDRLVIVGAGGFSREVAAAVEACNEIEPRFELLGYLDDDASLDGLSIDQHQVLGPLELLDDLTEVKLVVGIANPRRQDLRATVIERLALPPDRYATVVHPAASLGRGTAVGHGTVVLAGAVTTTGVTIGSHNVLMPHVVLTHDDMTAECVTFATGAQLSGGVRVNASAYLGAGALVREGCTIGARALVGMGAVVLRDVPDGEVWAGNPAQRLGPR